MGTLDSDLLPQRAIQTLTPTARSPLVTDPDTPAHTPHPTEGSGTKSGWASFQAAAFASAGLWLPPQDTAASAPNPHRPTQHRPGPGWTLRGPRGMSHSSALEGHSQTGKKGWGTGDRSTAPRPPLLPRGGKGGSRWLQGAAPGLGGLSTLLAPPLSCSAVLVSL